MGGSMPDGESFVVSDGISTPTPSRAARSTRRPDTWPTPWMRSACLARSRRPAAAWSPVRPARTDRPWSRSGPISTRCGSTTRRRCLIARAATGVMHACGHDAHAAMALGAALALWNCRDALPRDDRLAHDLPAVRGGRRGGVRDDRGGCDGARPGARRAPRRPRHGGGPGRPIARGSSRPSARSSRSRSRAWGGTPPGRTSRSTRSASASQFITSVYQFVPRSVDSRDPVVVTFGSIQGGRAPTSSPSRSCSRGRSGR